MRVPSYRCAARAGDSQILERIESEVPVAAVFEETIGSPDALVADGPAGLSPETNVGEPFLREEPVRLAAPGGDRDVRAVLVSDDASELVALLRDRCRSEGDGAVARLLRRIARHPGRAVQELVAAMQRDEHPSHPYPWAHGRVQRRGGRPELSTLAASYAFRHFTTRPGDSDARFYRETCAAACAPVTVAHGAHPVVRMGFVLAVPGESPTEPKALLTFDGSRFRLLRSAAEIVGPLAAQLDRGGRLYGRVGVDLLPQAHLVARCVLRAPRRAAIAAAKASSPRRKKPLARPGYLVDARTPVLLDGGEPVLDDPELVRAVLERTTHGIYLPGEPVGAGVPLHQLPEGESWWILADPGEAA